MTVCHSPFLHSQMLKKTKYLPKRAIYTENFFAEKSFLCKFAPQT